MLLGALLLMKATMLALVEKKPHEEPQAERGVRLSLRPAAVTGSEMHRSVGRQRALVTVDASNAGEVSHVLESRVDQAYHRKYAKLEYSGEHDADERDEYVQRSGRKSDGHEGTRKETYSDDLAAASLTVAFAGAFHP